MSIQSPVRRSCSARIRRARRRPRPMAGSRSTHSSRARTRWSRAPSRASRAGHRAADREERAGRPAPAARRASVGHRGRRRSASRSTARPSSCAASTSQRADDEGRHDDVRRRSSRAATRSRRGPTGIARSLQWLQVGAGETRVKLMLMPGAPVAGRVVDENGTGVAGARVTFHGASDWSQQADDRLDAATTGADGAFKFAALPAGSVPVRGVASRVRAGQTADGHARRQAPSRRRRRSRSVRARRCAARSSTAAKQPVASARVRDRPARRAAA